MRQLGLGPAKQRFVGVAHILATPVGAHHQAGGGPLGQQRPLQGAGDQGLGHVGSHLPAHHVFGVPILKGAQVRPVAIGQGQIREVALRWSAKSGQNRVVP